MYGYDYGDVYDYGGFGGGYGCSNLVRGVMFMLKELGVGMVMDMVMLVLMSMYGDGDG